MRSCDSRCGDRYADCDCCDGGYWSYSDGDRYYCGSCSDGTICDVDDGVMKNCYGDADRHWSDSSKTINGDVNLN